MLAFALRRRAASTKTRIETRGVLPNVGVLEGRRAASTKTRIETELLWFKCDGVIHGRRAASTKTRIETR